MLWLYSLGALEELKRRRNHNINSTIHRTIFFKAVAAAPELLISEMTNVHKMTVVFYG